MASEVVEKTSGGSFVCARAPESERPSRGRCRTAFVEIFSPPRFVPELEKRGVPIGERASFDKRLGWDSRRPESVRELWRTLRRDRPQVAWLCPECRAFSALNNINLDRMDPERRQEMIREGLQALVLCMEVAIYQARRGRFFAFEHPYFATSWLSEVVGLVAQLPGTQKLRIDMCTFDLQVHSDGLSKKPTGILTNHPGIQKALEGHLCIGGHKHVILENQLPRKAQVCPPKVREDVVRAVSDIWSGRQTHQPVSSRDMLECSCCPRVLACPELPEEGADGMGEDGQDSDSDVPETRPAPARTKAPSEPVRVSEDERRLVTKLHVNMGHPDNRKFVRVLRAGGTKHRVLRWIRDHFKCPECAERHGQENHRRVALPRTFRFNHIVGVDLFFLRYNNVAHPVLNVVDHGSNLQVCARLPDAKAATVWNALVSCWIRPFGAPHFMITDGGAEFQERFARGLKQFGVLHHVTDANSPWQNGRVERHGGWVKD